MPDEFREWIIDFGDSGYVARYRLPHGRACMPGRFARRETVRRDCSTSRLSPDAVTILAVRHQKEAGH